MYENKVEFTRIYNGACSRLDDRAMNAALNALIDGARADGMLAAAHRTRVEQEAPRFPGSIKGVPFVVALRRTTPFLRQRPPSCTVEGMQRTASGGEQEA